MTQDRAMQAAARAAMEAFEEWIELNEIQARTDGPRILADVLQEMAHMLEAHDFKTDASPFYRMARYINMLRRLRERGEDGEP